MYLASTAWRLAALLLSPVSSVFTRFDTRMSGLILGGIVAILIHRNIPRWFNEKVATVLGITAVAIIVASISIPTASGLSWGTISIEWATACLIVSVVTHPHTGVAPWLSARSLVAIGLVSYELYLWHVMILQAVPERFHPRGAF
jgi:peptidoglycan/LPS O-acetylase OafA/YrhL